MSTSIIIAIFAVVVGWLASGLKDVVEPWRERADEREERFVDVGALVVADAQAPELVDQAKVRSTTHRHRHAPPVADEMTFAPARPIGGIRTGPVTAVDRTDGTMLEQCRRPTCRTPCKGHG
jgi:hypothetical protein